MPKRTLRFRIRQDGLVEESVEGLLGDSCLTLTERIEEALGTVERQSPSSEAFLTSPQLQSDHISAKQIF